jgi:hypothetical protein
MVAALAPVVQLVLVPQLVLVLVAQPVLLGVGSLTFVVRKRDLLKQLLLF